MPLERAGGQAQFIYEQPAVVESMGPLLLWFGQNVDKQLSLSAIARHAAMSTRTLSRRFLEQVGTTPVRWIAGARVRRAQQLLETTSLSNRAGRHRGGIQIRIRAAGTFRRNRGNHAPRLPARFRELEIP